MESSAIFPIFYLPPIGYFSEWAKFDDSIELELFEHFPKQTYRNRASVYSPNGILDLIVPVVRGSKVHTKMKDVKISYEFNWQRLHWKSLESCYRNSAYFEYYESEFYNFYNKKYEFLCDLNIDILEWLLKQIKWPAQLKFSSEYQKLLAVDFDFRNALPVRNRENYMKQKPYYQVFEDRHGFIPNLSIVDLLFNQGPQAKSFI
ncbi:MAG: WbqC family protein [Bacteroidota bacterium]